MLDDLGLVAAARSWVAYQARISGFAASFHADLPGDEPRTEITSACFRALQEAVTNVSRHAAASEVEVSLVASTRELVLTVRDDGVGFEPHRVTLESRAAPARPARDGRAGRAGRWSNDHRVDAHRRHDVPGVVPVAPRGDHGGRRVIATIRVGLAEDHGMVRAGISRLIEDLPGVELVGVAEDGHEAIELVRTAAPDVLLLDITMPRLGGLWRAHPCRRGVPRDARDHADARQRGVRRASAPVWRFRLSPEGFRIWPSSALRSAR